VGVYAPDAEAYTLFKPLFDPIIKVFHKFTNKFKYLKNFISTKDYHNGFGPDQKQPATDLGEGKAGQLVDLDPEGKFINSTRVRCGRSLQGYPFNPCLTKENYLDMQNKVKAVFDQLKDG
jgi:hypothetical protein